jgi:hypothetical protein
MRAIAFILAFAFALGGGLFVETTATMPNAGLFMFDAPQTPPASPVIVASR